MRHQAHWPAGASAPLPLGAACIDPHQTPESLLSPTPFNNHRLSRPGTVGHIPSLPSSPPDPGLAQFWLVPRICPCLDINVLALSLLPLFRISPARPPQRTCPPRQAWSSYALSALQQQMHATLSNRKLQGIWTPGDWAGGGLHLRGGAATKLRGACHGGGPAAQGAPPTACSPPCAAAPSCATFHHMPPPACCCCRHDVEASAEPSL